MPEVSAALAEFVVGFEPGSIPAQVRRHAVRCIFNGVGTALGGSSDRAVLLLLETLGAYSSRPNATLIGHRQRVDAPTAAFLNAVAINVFDFDDTHEGTIIHPTAPVAPALFALAEQRAISGAELIEAFAIGAEVECRIGVAISPGHYKRGWHITSTCGVFGAAAAVGRLIGLDKTEMIWALGAASAQSSGLVETLGSMAKSISVGNAARNGLLAALMAQHGVEGPRQPLEGRHGFLEVFCDSPRQHAVTQGLGARWELMRNAFKPYPCGVVLNPVIDACLALRREMIVPVEVMERIDVIGNSLLKERTDRPAVTAGREAQVSAQHAVAVSIVRGSAGIADFNDDAVRDTKVAAFAPRSPRSSSTIQCRSKPLVSLSGSPTAERSNGPSPRRQAALRDLLMTRR